MYKTRLRNSRLRFFSMEGGAGGAGGSGGAGGDSGGAGGAGGDANGVDGGAQQQEKSGDNGGTVDGFKSEHSKQTVLADLASERAARADLQKQLDAITEKNKTDEQREREANEKRDADARTATHKAQQYEAADAAGLPLSWAKRISGSTPEEMLADAKQLKTDMTAEAGKSHSTDGAGSGGAGSDPAETAAPGVNRAAAYYQTKK